MNEEILFKGRKLALQAMLETYLKRNGKGSLKETFPDSEFEYGVLTNQHVALLHFYLAEEYAAVGLELNKEIEKNGETVVPGKLSNYEINELTRRADNLMLTVDILNEYRKNITQENTQ